MYTHAQNTITQTHRHYQALPSNINTNELKYIEFIYFYYFPLVFIYLIILNTLIVCVHTHTHACNKYVYVTLDHKTSLKSLGYICRNSQKIHCMGQNYTFFFYAKNHQDIK